MAKMSKPEAGADVEQDDQKTADATNRRITRVIKSRVEANGRRKRDLRDEWKRNVEIRMADVSGRGALAMDDDADGDLQSEINPDWYLTKAKVANLYSQVPQVQMTHENKQYAAAIPPFAKSLNYELSEKRANVGVAMDEVLNDVVNASGIGFVFVDYVARFDQVEVPAIDTSMIPPHLVDLAVQKKLIPTTMADRVVSDKFLVTRISPLDGIWPDDFVGSNFDDGDLVGYHGKLSASDFQNEFDVDDEFIERALGAAMPDRDQTLRTSDSRSTSETLAREVVEFDRIFYWRHRFDREETSFDAIWEIVLVKGIRKPVRHRPWAGQEYSEETGRYVGSCKFPVRVLTLTYVSDNPIVQSDTAAGRPQVNDMRTSRSQLFANRRRSVPVRWYDVNRVGLDIQAQLNDGTWQGWIPTNGDGTKAVGEQARASYPAEDLSFDQETYADLLQSWGLTPSALGNSTPGRKNQMEIGATTQGFATNIGKERAKVQSFFLGVCEVLAGLMALYSDFPILTAEEKQTLEQAWDHKHILHDLVCKIRPDSMIVLDPQQRYQRLSNHLNMTVKSGYINPKPIIWEMTELAGIDPSEVVIDPTPPPIPEPQLSFRFSGKDDLFSPAVMALLIQLKKAPTADAIRAAKQLLLEVQKAPEPVPAPDPGAGGAPAPLPPGAGAPPLILHPAQAEAHHGWHTASKVAKRSRDMNNVGGDA
jgi:hypothetical protein